MNGERVGIWSLPARGPQQFTYDESWLDSSLFRPLSLSLPAGLLHHLHEGCFANPRPIRCDVLADLAKPGLRHAGIASIDFNAIAPGVPMTSITIRNLDDKLKSRLRLQAAGHGRSMEEEVRQILAAALAPPAAPASSEPGLGSRIRAHFAQLGGMELEPPRRTSTPEPAALS